MSELRYHPFLRQWVITATHRQDRTFLPPPDFCPLCPTRPGGPPTEIPSADYDIAVFPNKFPSLQGEPPVPAVAGSPLMPALPAHGHCEVVCYTPDHDATFSELDVGRVRRLISVWRERYMDLSSRPGVEYVFIFENKGREIGVTLTHPHGQIYAYPFIPPVPGQELRACRAHRQETGRDLFGDWIKEELSSGSRTVWEGAHWLAVVPYFARWPFEVHVVPREQVRSLATMSSEQADELGEALLAVARKLDGLFGFSMPYVMAMHQEPVAGDDCAWFHVEFYPPYRTPDKLKFLAGSEAGAGTFINDTLPEESAAALRAVSV